MEGADSESKFNFQFHGHFRFFEKLTIFPEIAVFDVIFGDFEPFQANLCVGRTRYQKTKSRKKISGKF